MKLDSDGLRVCSKCNKIESSDVVFRKNRNQCINCVNIVRRSGNERKIKIEQFYIENDLNVSSDVFKNELKKQWYEDNKNRLSEENKIKYLNSRENRLKNASKNYYNNENMSANIIRRVKRRAKLIELDFNLTKEFIEELYVLQDRKCALTGLDFIFDKSNTSKRPFAPSVDRINSKLGYIKSNVRLVCVVVNFSLNEFGDEVFGKMCKAYVENSLCSF